MRNLKLFVILTVISVVTPACFKQNGSITVKKGKNGENQQQTEIKAGNQDQNGNGSNLEKKNDMREGEEAGKKTGDTENAPSKGDGNSNSNNSGNTTSAMSNLVLNLSDISTTELKEKIQKVLNGSPFKADSAKDSFVKQVALSSSVCDLNTISLDTWVKVGESLKGYFNEEFEGDASVVASYLAKTNLLLVLRETKDCKPTSASFVLLSQDVVTKIKEQLGIELNRSKFYFTTDRVVKGIINGASAGGTGSGTSTGGNTAESAEIEKNVVFNLSELPALELEDNIEAILKIKGIPSSFKKNAELDVFVQDAETDLVVCSLSGLKRSEIKKIGQAIVLATKGGSPEEINPDDKDGDGFEDEESGEEEEAVESEEVEDEEVSDSSEEQGDESEDLFSDTNILIVLKEKAGCKTSEKNFVIAPKRLIDQLSKDLGYSLNQKRVYMIKDSVILANTEMTSIVQDQFKKAKESCKESCKTEDVKDECAKKNVDLVKGQCDIELTELKDSLAILQAASNMCKTAKETTCPKQKCERTCNATIASFCRFNDANNKWEKEVCKDGCVVKEECSPRDRFIGYED